MGGASANPDDEIKGFSSLSLKEDQELKQNKPDGLFKRKMKRIFGAVGDTKTKFLQGFQMGAIIGGIFGGMMGCYMFFQTRQFIYIPISAVTSGGSFGFFMGVGMVMRSEMEGSEGQDGTNDNQVDEFQIVRINLSTSEDGES